MAHEISNSNGIDEVMVVGQPAWHHLGTNVQQAQSWEEASHLAHLDWMVDKVQMTNPVLNTPVDVFALLRSDTNEFLSSVGKQYVPIQNKDAFAWVDAIVGEHGAHYISAGALGRGERMWCLAKLPVTMQPVAGDKSDVYLLFTDSREGGCATVKTCLTRVVCNNTLQIALREKGISDAVLRLRHSSGVKDKLTAAKTLMQGAIKDVKELELKFKKMAEKKVQPPQLAQVLKSLFPNLEDSTASQNKARDILVNLQNNDDGKIKGIDGTAWSLLNACTKWADHQRDGLRVQGDASQLSRVRAESAMFGSGQEFKQQALDSILEAMGMTEVMMLGAGAGKADSILSKMSI